MNVLAIDPGPERSAAVGALVTDDFRVERVEGWMYEETGELLRGFSAGDAELVAIEAVEPRGQIVGRSVLGTAVAVGRCMESLRRTGPVLIYPSEIRIALCGTPAVKWTQVKAALLERCGGDEAAIGGKRCSRCKGRGWFGRGRPPCEECCGNGEVTPRGPLWGLWQERAETRHHVLQALAVGVAAAQREGG